MSFDLCFLFILYLHLFSLMVLTPVGTEPFVISRGGAGKTEDLLYLVQTSISNHSSQSYKTKVLSQNYFSLFLN